MVIDQSNFEEVCPVCETKINWSIFVQFKGCCCKECYDVAWEQKVKDSLSKNK